MKWNSISIHPSILDPTDKHPNAYIHTQSKREQELGSVHEDIARMLTEEGECAVGAFCSCECFCMEACGIGMGLCKCVFVAWVCVWIFFGVSIRSLHAFMSSLSFHVVSLSHTHIHTFNKTNFMGHHHRQGRPSVARAGVPSHAAAADAGEKGRHLRWLGCGVVWLFRVWMPVYLVCVDSQSSPFLALLLTCNTHHTCVQTQVCLLDDYLYIAAAGSNQVS